MLIASDSPAMRGPAFVLASLSAFLILLLLSGCTRQYFHESEVGDRYYQTASGDVLKVSRSGYVLKSSDQIGRATKASDGSDWDLRDFQVVAPSGHCLSVLKDEVTPTPCYALLWEVPLVILASPIAAIQDAFRERSVSVADVPASETPLPQEQQ